jgi:hypothetical protein
MTPGPRASDGRCLRFLTVHAARHRVGADLERKHGLAVIEQIKHPIQPGIERAAACFACLSRPPVQAAS